MRCPRCGEDKATYTWSVDFVSMSAYGLKIKKSFCVCPQCHRELLTEVTQNMRVNDADSDTGV